MKASIIIRTYNNEESIKRAIESALLQNFPKKDYEIIVINDGSTDKTKNILREYRDKIILVNQKNQGAIAAANRGFKMARGKYVITLDSDDYFAKNLLSEMIKIFDKNPKINFVYSDYYETLKTGKTKIFRVKNIFQTIACATMYHKKDLAKEGFWKKIKFPEYEILLKTLERWEGYHLKKSLYHFTRRPQSLSGKNNWIEAAIQELKKMHPDKIREIKKIRKFE